MTRISGRVLIIAGSDSGGGAGIQADIKTVTALSAHAMTAVTAVTVQNTLGVTGVHPIPPEVVAAQIRAVMDDLGADCWKTGMLADSALVELVAAEYDARAGGAPLVVDPVMIAKGGHALLADDAVGVLRDALVPRAAVLTPNAPEAARLVGFPVEDMAAQQRAGAALLKLGARSVLVKGGHIAGPIVRDVFASADGIEAFEAPRIETRATHGTGCTLASAIAAGLAQGMAARDAIVRARSYVRAAILAAPGLGRGAGPLGHGWNAAPVAAE
ncbi:MAG: bifunctional hydroxymethylpyrimidine kinase/phosphomethylpyrimidine kinase [Hydrogenophilaceae bacterium]|jgi:hydroxymethylpyrimidine/phosphomethylpyrimidine kinase|nr:bifunctional hydroxymethylpyrimidine kinase/phosphomethylpyrimidine kinase [Hydrogenophilaceae bacterium]